MRVVRLVHWDMIRSRKLAAPAGYVRAQSGEALVFSSDLKVIWGWCISPTRWLAFVSKPSLLSICIFWQGVLPKTVVNHTNTYIISIFFTKTDVVNPLYSKIAQPRWEKLVASLGEPCRIILLNQENCFEDTWFSTLWFNYICSCLCQWWG